MSIGGTERTSSQTAYISDGRANQAHGVQFIFRNVDILKELAPLIDLILGFTFAFSRIKMYTYIHKGLAMANTKLFKNGNSQAVRIPAELAYNTWDIDLVIERQGDELRIRPAQRRMGDVLGKLAKFSPDFMAQGRGENMEGERAAL